MGVTGSAWATNFARLFMAVSLLLLILRPRTASGIGLSESRSWRSSGTAIARLFRLGAPAATQLTAEVGVFGAVAALAGRIDPMALAAHQVALNMASVTFMVPLGLASAGAVRVGHAIGRRTAGRGQRGRAVIALGGGFMTAPAWVSCRCPSLVRLFTTDAAVVATGVVLMQVAAAFQLFDGLQVVTTGALRGLGDTRTPMFANLVGHWLIAFPLPPWAALAWATASSGCGSGCAWA